MRIVFLGTPEFAVTTLDHLLKEGFDVAAVVTAPDKPAGRGRELKQSAVKTYAVEKGMKVLQPDNLKDAAFLEELRSLHADVQVVVAFRMLPEAVWNMPRLGTFNLHASLLPAYRGAAPINWAIINGEKETGVTTFKLKHEIDSGNILLQEKIGIDRKDNAGSLHDRMMYAGAKLMVRSMRMLEDADRKGTSLSFIEQDITKISHAPKLNRENCRINWSRTSAEIMDLVRGLSPYPAAYTQYNRSDGQSFEWKIFLCEVSGSIPEIMPGALFCDGKRLMAGTGNGALEILELQQQGKKRMRSEEFLRGTRIQKGDKLS